MTQGVECQAILFFPSVLWPKWWLWSFMRYGQKKLPSWSNWRFSILPKNSIFDKTVRKNSNFYMALLRTHMDLLMEVWIDDPPHSGGFLCHNSVHYLRNGLIWAYPISAHWACPAQNWLYGNWPYPWEVWWAQYGYPTPKSMEKSVGPISNSLC